MAASKALKSEVIQLYKNLLYMGREYPAGHEYFRTKLRAVFRKNSTETDPEKIRRMLQHGEFITKELEALYMLRKYRTLKKRYYSEEAISPTYSKIERVAQNFSKD